MSFLQAQGVAGRAWRRRATASGFPSRTTRRRPAGAKNRRVEIILAEGVIQGAQ
jgi:hypothetical protein